jgi:uncharacterized membrane protein YvbJ
MKNLNDKELEFITKKFVEGMTNATQDFKELEKEMKKTNIPKIVLIVLGSAIVLTILIIVSYHIIIN